MIAMTVPLFTLAGYFLAEGGASKRLIRVFQAWLGQFCPLTTLESWLRIQAGAAAYERSFIEHWLQRLIFYEAPFWVFTMVYTAFAALVALAWWRFPPRWGSSRSGDA